MKITEGKASMDSGKGKEIVEDSEPEEEHPLSPMFRTQMELPVKELPPFVWRREDVTTFIWHVDEIAQGACWTDNKWALTCLVGVQPHLQDGI